MVCIDWYNCCIVHGVHWLMITAALMPLQPAFIVTMWLGYRRQTMRTFALVMVEKLVVKIQIMSLFTRQHKLVPADLGVLAGWWWDNVCINATHSHSGEHLVCPEGCMQSWNTFRKKRTIDLLVEPAFVILTKLMSILFSFVIQFLIFDTQSVVGGRKYNLSEEEYVYGALQLYIDVVQIFLALLSVFGASK